MTPDSLTFTCPDCGVRHEHLAVHTTVVLDADLLYIVAVCPGTGRTARGLICESILHALLLLPVLVDPDARDHINAREKAKQ